jgi:hypothetical protein
MAKAFCDALFAGPKRVADFIQLDAQTLYCQLVFHLTNGLRA